jgi:pyridoxamine 5'-phosphate oxidase
VIGIDAPTVFPPDVPNAIVMRSADRLAHSLYGKYRAGPSPANLLPAFWNRTTQLSASLEHCRFSHGDQLTPRSGGRHQIEVHPPAAAVQLFSLSRVIRYRRGTVSERREGLRLLRGLMLDHFPRLFPRLAISDLPEIPMAGPALKAMADRLDSLVSAYVAAHWWYWGRQRNELLGNSASGYIVVPYRRTAELKLADLREELMNRDLLEAHVSPQPIAQFKAWLWEAFSAGVAAPNAMTLATVAPDGKPSARIVLLNNVDERGFTFFTSYRSGKARELAENPRAALVFHWAEVGRQVRINGCVEKATRAEAEAFFRMQPREVQLSTWASWQSSAIADREFLDQRIAKVERKYGETEVPTPSSWGGYRLRPISIEFWQSRADQLHDRLLYSCRPDGRWALERLAP